MILIALLLVISGCGANNSTDDTTEAISLNQVGEYSGAPYVYLNNNMPYFTDEEKENTKPFENYSSLDDLGRCGVAFANIYKELMPTEERGPIGQIKPSGWHTVKYNGIIDGNYLYNRCHLIGYQLTAENACCRVSQLAVNGRDLMAAGVRPGPGLRQVLNALLEAVITGQTPNEKDALLAAAAQFSAS